jgi:hypothetical protein
MAAATAWYTEQYRKAHEAIQPELDRLWAETERVQGEGVAIAEIAAAFYASVTELEAVQAAYKVASRIMGQNRRDKVRTAESWANREECGRLGALITALNGQMQERYRALRRAATADGSDAAIATEQAACHIMYPELKDIEARFAARAAAKSQSQG